MSYSNLSYKQNQCALSSPTLPSCLWCFGSSQFCTFTRYASTFVWQFEVSIHLRRHLTHSDRFLPISPAVAAGENFSFVRRINFNTFNTTIIMRFPIATLAALALFDRTSADLHSLAVAAGKKYFGTATDNNELSDFAYTAVTKIVGNFGQITPGNGQKWDYTEPTQGRFQYTYADVVPNFAKANGQILRCHTLLYRSQIPTWLTGGSWTKASLASVIKTHIENLVGHYKGQCYSWDVVNEAIDDSGNYRDTVFYTVLGLDYLTLAFNTAHASDPAAKLYYNDYNIESTNAKQQRTIELVKYVQDAGAPIHGVGLQGHFIVGSMPSQEDLESVANSFTALGVDVAYTEVDVKFTSLPYTSAGLQSQAEAYVAVINACLNVEGCVGWTIWDWTDKYSWVPGTFPGQGGACIFDSNFKPKPAYSSVSSALAAAASKASSTKASTTGAVTATPTITSKTRSAVVTPSLEVSKASTVIAANSTTVIRATSVANSSAIVSTRPINFSSAPTLTMNTTAIYPNGTATATGSAGATPTISAGIISTVTPGPGASVPGSSNNITDFPGNVPAPTPSTSKSDGGSATTDDGYVISTIYTTKIYTVTSCASAVTDCAANAGSLTTEVAAFTTTVMTSTMPPPASTSAPVRSAPISPCDRKRLRRRNKKRHVAAT